MKICVRRLKKFGKSWRVRREPGAIVKAVTAHERIVGLMRIMNGEHALEMEAGQVERAG